MDNVQTKKEYEIKEAPIKRILKDNTIQTARGGNKWSLQISKKAVIRLRNHLEEYAEEIAKKSGEIAMEQAKTKIDEEDVKAAIKTIVMEQ